METLVDQIIQSPRLPQYLEEIQAFWRKEADKRKQFYMKVVEDHKMEFINGEIYLQSPVKLQHNIPVIAIFDKAENVRILKSLLEK